MTHNNPKTAHERLTVFFDGACPLCSREVELIASKDQRSSILFVDIAAPGFSVEGLGVSYEELMRELHAFSPQGELIVGVEVFRQMYARIGYPRLSSWSRAFGIRHVLQLGYRVWAQNRLRLTGRCSSGVCDVKSGAGA